ncbi:MAG: FecR domain-containing protein [Planctomycetaceae bacterium]|nr:FecR domain-containing protein [Planctomycetaceae bacterium]
MNTEQLSLLEILLLKHADGTISADEVAQLNQLLINNAQAQDHYFDFMKTLLALKQSRSFALVPANDRSEVQQMLEEMGRYEKHAEVLELEKPKPAKIEKIQRSPSALKVSRFALYTAVVSAAALVLMVLLVRMAPLREHSVAFLERAVDAQWENVSGTISKGDRLDAGPMKLVRGYVEITMRAGGSVILQAPAEFTLESSRQIFLQSGRLTATVANAGGDKTFVVRSPFGSIVDYGTEFGVYVGSEGATETYVFRGKVQLRDSSDPLKFKDSILLSEGQGAAAELSGGILQIASKKVNSTQFVRSTELALRDQAQQGSSYQRWLVYNYSVQRDPSLVVHYRFEEDAAAGNRLINSAPGTGESLCGILGDPVRPQSAPTWAEGKWPQTKTLVFDRAKEQVVRVPDDPRLRIAGPITVAAWVKLPADEQPQGGLLLSHRTVDNINYQIVLGKRPSVDSMVLAFGRYATHLAPKIHSDFLELPGQTWHHLVITHDNAVVEYYVDGRLVTAVPYVFQGPPVAADLYIGFTPVAESAGFNGTLGELLIFDRALSEQEVLTMYSQTKP